MTHNRNHDDAQSGKPHSLPVRFEFTDAEAGSVSIAGTFNDWQPNAHPMHRVANDRWAREFVLPVGTHEYCLVVNGKFYPDPLAAETFPKDTGDPSSMVWRG
jgi:hypothetical protein